MYPLYRKRRHWEAPDHWSPEWSRDTDAPAGYDDESSLTPAGLFGFPESLFRRGYPVNIHEEGGDLLVEAELPGFKKDQIRISIDGEVLRIHAARETVEPKGARYLTERKVDLVNRSLRLPAAVDKSRTEAHLEDGVLKIRAPMVSGVSGSEITIK